MAVKKTLDFLGIGAGKSGTTSLFEYLQVHPQIYIPPEKECSYFSENNMIAKGWNWYLDRYFGNANPVSLWGTITPQYMYSPQAPSKIKEALPHVKLIALLRNPIARAHSSYRMNIRKYGESRTFEVAVLELLTPDALEKARQQPKPMTHYLVNGEYGRALARYYELFDHDQIAIYFTQDLRQNPESVLQSIFRFLKVDAEFVSPNLNTIYYQGGGKHRLRGIDYAGLSRKKILRPLTPVWKMLVPQRARSLFWRRLETWNVIPDKEEDKQIAPAVQNLLKEHYGKDSELLAELIGKQVPWLSKWSAQA